jgi:endonuclease YncB( thermonuclease family)
MKRILFFYFLIFAASLYPQKVKVTKVIDSNLFELSDGRIVKLAGIDVPMLSHPSKFFQSAARDAVDYSKINLLDRFVTVEAVGNLSEKDSSLVMMYKNYLFNKVNVSTRFLLYGYGKFFNNVDDKWKAEFLDFQKSAIEEKRGIWLNDNLTMNDTLDAYFMKDSLNIRNRLLPEYVYRSSPRPLYFQIPLELLAGTGMTIITGIASGVVIYMFEDKHGAFSGFGAVMGGSILGYCFGFPLGVYLTAKPQNPNVSLPLTMLSGVGLTVGMFGITSLIAGEDRNSWVRFLPLFAPIIGSLVYAHILAPQNSEQSNKFINTNLTHAQLYKSKQIINLNLVRISF